MRGFPAFQPPTIESVPDSLALMFGFDGTLYVGDLPILAYARRCTEHLAPDAATAMIDGIRFFLEGKTISDRHIDLQGAEDGRQAVEILATALGLTADRIRLADQLARADMAASAFALDVPEGLSELLSEMVGVHVVVVTNAQGGAVAGVLSALGLAEHVHEVVADAGKPDNMSNIVAATLSRIGATGEPHRLMVIGDRWSDDLADAARIGAVTGLIDRFGRDDGNPTFRARDLTGLIPDIRQWAARQGAAATGALR
jgi:FMN phosphatase YigB (HAD superfamily)